MKTQPKVLLLFVLTVVFMDRVAAQTGKLVDLTLHSTILRENKIGLKTDRGIKVYLPPGYEHSKKAYPVVYYLHNFFEDEKSVFSDGKVDQLLDRAFSEGAVKEFIFVAADYSSAGIGSIYENSPVSGRWLDYTVQEVVPFIDSSFRTIRNRDSRAVTGHFFGGRGALKLGMIHPDVFGVVYAMHPVAVGMGSLPWTSLGLDFNKISQVKSVAGLGSDFRGKIFLTVCQAFLPNLNRPPLYCDFLAEPEKGEWVWNAGNVMKAKAGFHLEETLNEAAQNLKSLRALAFDWGRFDGNPDHVYAAREFSRKLVDLGVEHEAEEYNGGSDDKIWTYNGRFYTRVVPFFGRHLVF